MTLSGLLLVLCAAFCHAGWNFVVKRMNVGPELIWATSLVSVILYLPAAIWVFVVHQPVIDPTAIFFFAGTAVLHTGYFLLLQIGYRHGDLSLVYPIARATGPLLSTTLAILVLGELVTLQMAAGALTIIFGVLMLSGGLQAKAQNAKTSVLFGLAVGSLIGSYTAWDAYAVSVLLISPLLMDYFGNLGRALILSPMAIRRGAAVGSLFRNHWRGILIISFLSPLAYILVLYALTFTPVAYVAPLREVSVLLLIVAGSLILKEGALRHRLGWGVLVLIGMALLATA